MKVVIANDHGGVELAKKIISHLEERGIEYSYLGTASEESVDYPDYAKKAVIEYRKGGYDFGILICGTGIGISISANKQLSHIKVLKDGLTIQEQSAYSNNVIVYLLEDHTFDITALYQVEATFSETGMTLTKQVDAYSYYRGSAFEETYAVSEETKLGAYVDENTNKTHFAVWSPYAKEIKVNIYNNGTPTSVSSTLGDDTKYLSLDMEKASNGLFSITVDERLYDKYGVA